jgi:uncharacterized damage-inducible protein DinB
MLMKRILILGFAVIASCGLGMAESKQTVSQVLNSRVTNVQKELVSAAEAMPEDKYSFVPTTGEFKGVRTFAEQIKHVAAVNYMFGAIIRGEKPPADEKGPEPVKSKADILKFLNDSYDNLHQAIATMDDKNMLEPIPSPFGKDSVTRLEMAVLAAQHSFDHYGQMVVYLRLNGIVPPASR